MKMDLKFEGILLLIGLERQSFPLKHIHNIAQRSSKFQSRSEKKTREFIKNKTWLMEMEANHKVQHLHYFLHRTSAQAPPAFPHHPSNSHHPRLHQILPLHQPKIPMPNTQKHLRNPSNHPSHSSHNNRWLVAPKPLILGTCPWGTCRQV